ncbi:hypothetical protein A0J61_00053 [Choanephora cucurbitarum]|uniref:Protein byr4 n=1 Tax=Choanephora cucurbitarum TaxID=101091 RepID=A0A1C7NS24_9FUNG|nr:hypothetical protein A0J61_00053 [Choanephora cucurbitarum]
MTSREDDWEVDINLGSSTGRNVFQRKGVFNYEPDKELALACERYQYAIPNIYSDGEDDADSSIASSSIISGQLSELSLINLDNFMYDEEPTLTAETILPDNQNKFPGTIRKLRARHKENQDHDDWNDDIEIPSRNIQFSLTKKKSYEQLLDVFDDNDSIGPSVSQRGSPCSFEVQTKEHTQPSRYRYVEQDEDSFSELDFPENMALLPKKLNEKKSIAYDRLSPASHVTAVDSNKSTAKKSSLLTKVKRENDNDDFLEGLEIKEKVFKASISASKLPIPQPQRSTSTNKTKSGTSHFVSRLARPTQTRPNVVDQAAKRTPFQSAIPQVPQQRQPPPIRRNILSNPQTTLPRETELPTRHTAYTYKQPPQRKQFSLRNNLQLMNNNTSLPRNAESSPSEKRGANGSTLIAKPKTKIPISYCSRLDNIDNLNDLQPMRSRTTKMEPKDFSRNERINIDHSWKKSGQPSKIKLIQPNEQNLRKEYHGMKYDFRTHSWKGNESGLIDFPEKPAVKKHPKLVLLTSKQRTPSKYTAIMSDNMIFKPESQSWVSPSGKENNDLDGIEDLPEDLRPVSKRMPKHSQYRNKMTEFKLSIEIKRQMMAEQQQHENLIKQWPLNEEESYMTSTAGHKVPVSKYFLFTQSF